MVEGVGDSSASPSTVAPALAGFNPSLGGGSGGSNPSSEPESVPRFVSGHEGDGNVDNAGDSVPSVDSDKSGLAGFKAAEAEGRDGKRHEPKAARSSAFTMHRLFSFVCCPTFSQCRETGDERRGREGGAGGTEASFDDGP